MEERQGNITKEAPIKADTQMEKSKETETKEKDQYYTFQDVEKWKEAHSFEFAFDKVFGHDRHFGMVNDGEIKLNERDDIVNTENGFEKRKVISSVALYIEMDVNKDTRQEMIDYLHYLKYSGLLEQKEHGFTIFMFVYQPTEPGMNTPQPHQEWRLKSDKVHQMKFEGNKKNILGDIKRYGRFKGMNKNNAM